MASRDREQMTIDIARRLPMILAACAFGILLSACLASRKPLSQSAGGRDLFVTAWASTNCVSAGDTLVARATVTNTDSVTKLVDLKDRPVFDLSIGYRAPGGSVVVRWSDGKPLTSDLTRMELRPGESKSIEIKWVVIDPPPSAIGVTATFIEDIRYIDHPLFAFLTVGGPSTCPGPFGP